MDILQKVNFKSSQFQLLVFSWWIFLASQSFRPLPHLHSFSASQLQCLALAVLWPLKAIHWLFIYRLLCRLQVLFPPVKNNKRSGMRESSTPLALLAHRCHTACCCFSIPALNSVYIIHRNFTEMVIEGMQWRTGYGLAWMCIGNWPCKSNTDAFFVHWIILSVKLYTADILYIVFCSMFFFLPYKFVLFQCKPSFHV